MVYSVTWSAATIITVSASMSKKGVSVIEVKIKTYILNIDIDKFKDYTDERYGTDRATPYPPQKIVIENGYAYDDQGKYLNFIKIEGIA